MKTEVDKARISGALQEVVPAVHCVVTDQLLALAFPPHPCAVSPSIESGVTALMPSEVRAMVLSSWEITKKIITMYVPKINTTEGKKPVTVLPNEVLLEGYLYSDAPAEDKEVARCLFTLDDKEYAGAVLRRALNGGELVVVYPGLNQKPPKGAELVCSVADGSLYYVKAL